MQKPIEIPTEWESKIQPSLLSQADDIQRDILNEVNKLDQKVTKLLEVARDQSVREVDRAAEIERNTERIEKLEKFVDAVKSKWSLAIGASFFIGAAIDVMAHLREWATGK